MNNRRKESRSPANPQYRAHASRPLAAVGVWPLRQPCVQHPVVAPAQGVDERGGVRTTVKDLAALGVQRIDFQMEHFLEDADDIHYFQFPAFRRTYRTGCHQCGYQFNQIAVRTVPCQCDGSSLPVSMYRLSLESGGHAAIPSQACRMKVSSIFV